MTESAGGTGEQDKTTQSHDTAEATNAPDARQTSRRTRKPRPFPAMSFKEALFLGTAIQEHGSGQKVRRLTLFSALDRSPDSGPTRKLITASNQYGITEGSYSAKFLDLTPEGRVASDPNSAPRAQLQARISLAVLNISSFKAIYDRYQGSRLPTVEVLRDAAREAGIDTTQTSECVEIYLANVRELGLIQTIGGSEHLIEVDAALEALSDENTPVLPRVRLGTDALRTDHKNYVDLDEPPLSSPAPSEHDLTDVCFIVSPIGGPDSEERKHADLVLSSLIEPALKELSLRPVRADKISKPGLITGQVIDHLTRAAMVIADLSFGNPNVYYELALRHATRMPVVQVIRSSDTLPFDVSQFRTVVIDMTDIYTLVPRLDLHRQEITRQCRSALDEGTISESPLSRFYPQFWDHIPKTNKKA